MIRVLLVDDSALMRRVLRELLEGSPDFQIVGEATNGLAGCEKNLELQPDLVVMDIDMPVMDGVTATARIMRERPVPILVFSAAAESPAGFAALEAGARDVLRKPDFDAIGDEAFRQTLYERIRTIASAVPRQHPGSARPYMAGANAGAALRAVVMGASTGGPVAVKRVLSSLPADFPLGIALVQHLEDGFDEGYVRWLGEECALRVLLATASTANGAFAPGTVTVAPVNRHLIVRGGALELDDGPRIVNQKPAVDALFTTASAWFGSSLVGVLLTGMGRDGADGCKAIVDSGGRTLVQDKETSAIYGMPKAAADIGAATEVLPLDAIAPRLVALAGGSRRP